MPVVLNVPRDIRPLLTDETDGIDGAAVGIAKEEGSERRPAQLGVIAVGYAGIKIAKAGAARDALASEAVVVADLKRPPHLDGVRFTDHREVVVVGKDGIFAAVVSAATPAGEVTKIQVEQVLIAIGNVAEADLVFPVYAALEGSLRRIVIFAPIVTTSIEVVQHGGGNSPVPAPADHIGIALRVVVVGVKAGQGGGAAGTRYHRRTVVAVVAGHAVLVVEDMVALDAPLGVGADFRTGGDEVVVTGVSHRSRRGTVIRR